MYVIAMKTKTPNLFKAMTFISFSFLLISSVSAMTLDQKLKGYIQDFNWKSPKIENEVRLELYELGESLFQSNLLSGNENISCQSCHALEFASADGLPLALGAGSRGRTQGHASELLSRHTPALFNVSNNDEFFFWDGRVRFSRKFYEFVTPSEVLNGEYPEAWEITEVLEGALSAQVLFPLIDEKEMMGSHNSVALAQDDLSKWEVITTRVLEDSKLSKLVTKAYPKVNKAEINIAHLANAIAEYETFKFVSNNSPWDRYLSGELDAISEREKKGAIAFVEKGSCTTCHSGPLFTDHSFQNVAAPQMGEGFDIHKNDEGRFYVTKKSDDLYKFKVPSLRNVALTAPYFHSGVYTTLEEVLDHYMGGTQSLDHYSPHLVYEKYSQHYLERLFVETGDYRLFRKKEDAHELIKGKKIRLTGQERSNIILFLRKSLTSDF